MPHHWRIRPISARVWRGRGWQSFRWFCAFSPRFWLCWWRPAGRSARPPSRRRRAKPAAAKPAAKANPSRRLPPSRRCPAPPPPPPPAAAPDAKPEQSTAEQSMKDSYAALTLQRAAVDPVRSGLDRRLQRPDQRRVQRPAGRRGEGVPEAQQVEGHRRAQSAGARHPRRVGEAAAERGRLAAGRGSGQRRARRPARQAGADRDARRIRHALEFAAGPVADRDLPHAQHQLEAAYERQHREPFDRRPGYNVLRPDFFVISGMQGLKKFYVRASAQDNEVRGITILYDQAKEGTMEPVVVAMSSAFVPFAQLGALQEGVPSRRKVEYGTGLVVSGNGHVVTDKQIVDGCRSSPFPASATPSGSPRTRRASLRCCASMARAISRRSGCSARRRAAMR